MPLVPDPKNCDISVKRAIQGLSKKLGYTGSPTFANTTITNVITASTSVFSKTCEVAAGLNVLRVTGLQTDDTALTGTLRGAYIDVSNGSTEATGTIRALELKARTEAPDDTGSKVAVLEGLSISADSKARDVTTMRAAEFILDGKTAGTIDEVVGLRIANNLQVDKATLSYGLQIYRDSFDYTYDISLSLGGHITGDSYVNQDLRTTASPTFTGLHINSAEVTSTTLLTLESDINNNNEYNEILFKIVGGQNYGAIRSCVGAIGGDSYMSFFTTTDSGTLVRQVTIQHNGKVGLGTYNPETLLTIVSAAPYLTLHNVTEEDTDGGGESRIIGKREDGAGTPTAAGQIEISHDGSGVNDQLGKYVVSVNTGAGLVQALEIGSDLLATFAGAITAANYTAVNLLTACATNTGALDFSAASKTLTVEDDAIVSQDYSSDASPQFTGIELGHASDTTITRVSAGVIAVEGVTVMMVGGSPTAHVHDGDTLQLDAINSSAGSFAFDTGGLVTFNESITMSAGKDLTIAGHVLFNTDDSYIGFVTSQLAFNGTDGTIIATGNIIIPGDGTIGQAAGPLLTFDDTNDYLEISGCKVGIGTVTPTHGIHLEGSNVVAASLKIVNTQASAGSAGAGYFLYSDDGAALVSGNRFGFIAFGGSYDAAHNVGSGAAITGFADETWSATNRGSRIQFETAANGATGRTEQMRIDNSGGIFVYSLKSGVDQAAAGAAANELYRDTDNNSIKMGV